MIVRRFAKSPYFPVAALIALFLLVAQLPQPLPDHLTKWDFRVYWAASHMLGHGQDFTDPQRVLAIQQEKTGWERNWPQLAWNPPWLLAWFLPLSLIDFDRASWIWFLTNLGLIFTSIVLLWEVYMPQQRPRRYLWLPVLVAFTFDPALTALLIGQISALVLVGLAGFLFFAGRRQWFSAGLLLSFVTAKPHIVFITLPLVLLTLFTQRRWRALAGFSLLPILGTLTALLLRPEIVSDYITAIGGGQMLHLYAASTLSFQLAQVFGWPALRFIGLALLPLLVAIWWQRDKGKSWALPDLVALTVVPSVVTSFYGYSFDVLVYLLPMTQAAIWMITSRQQWHKSVVVATLFLVATYLIWFQRIGQMREDEYFWFPTVLAGLYLLCRFTIRRPEAVLSRRRTLLGFDPASQG